MDNVPHGLDFLPFSADRSLDNGTSLIIVLEIEVPLRLDGKRRNLARVSDTKSLTSDLLFPSTSDGTCFSHDKKERFVCFNVKLAS